jgi:hypothetical protein
MRARAAVMASRHRLWFLALEVGGQRVARWRADRHRDNLDRLAVLICAPKSSGTRALVGRRFLQDGLRPLLRTFFDTPIALANARACALPTEYLRPPVAHPPGHHIAAVPHVRTPGDRLTKLTIDAVILDVEGGEVLHDREVRELQRHLDAPVILAGNLPRAVVTATLCNFWHSFQFPCVALPKNNIEPKLTL